MAATELKLDDQLTSIPTLLSVNSKCLLVSHHRVVRDDTWLTGVVRAHHLFSYFAMHALQVPPLAP